MASVFDHDVVKTIRLWMNRMREKCVNLWNTSSYFRIVSIVSASITGSLIARHLYGKYYRKYYNMPPGPLGLPFLGDIHKMMDLDGWKTIAPLQKYGAVSTIALGPMNIVLISDPYLAKKIYSDPRTLDVNEDFMKSDLFLNQVNGEIWAQRRKIIFANIMSTMKASFVEDSTKQFIKNKLFPVFDEYIKENKCINDIKSLFRPIGFNIVLHSCFGQELQSLKDPFWLKYEKESAAFTKDAFLLRILMFFFSPQTLQIFGMKSWDEMVEPQMNVIQQIAESETHKIEYDVNNKDIKLWTDYIKQYESSKHKSITKKHLIADMSIMLMASTDTTYMALAYSLLELAKNENIQNELYEELCNAFNNDMNNIQLSNKGIFKIPKLRGFVQESLRIHPPAPAGGFRQMKSDGFKIDTRKFGGDKVYSLPKGCQYIINILAISHEPKWWIKNYDPQNNVNHKNIDMNKIHLDFWLDENGKFDKKSQSDLFLIFSRGKRDCIGRSLAEKVIYITLAMIIIKYKLGPLNEDIKFNTKTRMIEPNQINLQRR